jgi:hypothetical protein
MKFGPEKSRQLPATKPCEAFVTPPLMRYEFHNMAPERGFIDEVIEAGTDEMQVHPRPRLA